MVDGGTAYLAGVVVGGSVVCVLAVILVVLWLFRNLLAMRRFRSRDR